MLNAALIKFGMTKTTNLKIHEATDIETVVVINGQVVFFLAQ